MQHISIGLIKLLQDGADKGYWTVEQLDRSSPGWTAGTKVDRRYFKNGYQGIEHRNLLRDSGYTPDPNTTTNDLPF